MPRTKTRAVFFHSSGSIQKYLLYKYDMIFVQDAISIATQTNGENYENKNGEKTQSMSYNVFKKSKALIFVYKTFCGYKYCQVYSLQFWAGVPSLTVKMEELRTNYFCCCCCCFANPSHLILSFVVVFSSLSQFTLGFLGSQK